MTMNSISPECQDLKNQYDDCFNKWFKDHFLNGTTDNRMCSTIFGSYQDCVKVDLTIRCNLLLKLLNKKLYKQYNIIQFLIGRTILYVFYFLFASVF